MNESFRNAPFFLGDTELTWVNKTYSELMLEQKVGQLFNLIVRANSAEELSLIDTIQPGAVTRVCRARS